MSCGGCCIGNLTHALKADSRGSDVKVPLLAGETTVQLDERLTSRNQLKAAVKGAGYSVEITNIAQNFNPRTAAAVNPRRQLWS